MPSRADLRRTARCIVFTGNSGLPDPLPRSIRRSTRTPAMFTGRACACRRKAASFGMGTKQLSGFPARNGSALPRRRLTKGRSSVIAQGDNEGVRGCTPGTDR